VHEVELTAGPCVKRGGRLSAQAAELLVQEHENVVSMLLQQVTVE